MPWFLGFSLPRKQRNLCSRLGSLFFIAGPLSIYICLFRSFSFIRFLIYILLAILGSRLQTVSSHLTHDIHTFQVCVLNILQWHPLMANNLACISPALSANAGFQTDLHAICINWVLPLRPLMMTMRMLSPQLFAVAHVPIPEATSSELRFKNSTPTPRLPAKMNLNLRQKMGCRFAKVNVSITLWI